MPRPPTWRCAADDPAGIVRGRARARRRPGGHRPRRGARRRRRRRLHRGGHRRLRSHRVGGADRELEDLRQDGDGRRRHPHRALAERRRRGPRSACSALVDELDGRCVVKADGLALGKGVIVCDDRRRGARRHRRLPRRAALRRAPATRCWSRSGSRDRRSACSRSPTRATSACCPPRATTSASATATPGPNTGGMGALTPPAGVDSALARAGGARGAASLHRRARRDGRALLPAACTPG